MHNRSYRHCESQLSCLSRHLLLYLSIGNEKVDKIPACMCMQGSIRAAMSALHL